MVTYDEVVASLGKLCFIFKLVVINLFAEHPKVHLELLLPVKVLVKASYELRVSLLALEQNEDSLFKVANRDDFEYIRLFDWSPISKLITLVNPVLDIFIETH